MIGTTLAVIILAGLAIILALVIPLLNAVPKLSNFISLRWSCIAIILLIMVGVVIDFEPLSDTTRDIALSGGLVVVGIFLVLRTLEKVFYNGWLKGLNIKGSVTKGDATASLELKQTNDVLKKDSVNKDNGNIENTSNEN